MCELSDRSGSFSSTLSTDVHSQKPHWRVSAKPNNDLFLKKMTVVSWPCDEVATHPGCTLTSPMDSWNRLQLTPTTLTSVTTGTDDE